MGIKMTEREYQRRINAFHGGICLGIAYGSIFFFIFTSILLSLETINDIALVIIGIGLLGHIYFIRKGKK